MPITTPPELVRSDVSLFLLQLKALGIDNVLRFEFMSPPPSEMMIRALEFLFCLKALDEEGRLTKPFGMRMAEVPVDPMMAAIVSMCWAIPAVSRTDYCGAAMFQLLNSHEFRCGEEILSIAAMTSVQVSAAIGIFAPFSGFLTLEHARRTSSSWATAPPERWARSSDANSPPKKEIT
jgi:ATP-dependent RNA helicase DDX35